ncbi:MAG TPA: type II secretion system ATPase GspE [Methylotenera sp.]|nr:type II secretion system ATPase GspE [Methylotenera sp.]
MLRRGSITPEQIQRIALYCDKNAGGTTESLLEAGQIMPNDLAHAFSEWLSLPLWENLDGLESLSPPVCPNLSRKFMRHHRFVPIDLASQTLTIVMSDPLDNFVIEAIKLAMDVEIHIVVATPSQVESLFEKLYEQDETSISSLVDAISVDQINDDASSIDRLKDLAAEAPIVRLVNLLINQAITLKASDIHIEPFAQKLMVRYRVDGVLQSAESPPRHSAAAVISRIKIMANMDIAERRLPQDGRIHLRSNGKNIDLRVSTTPTLHGESLVMRILDNSHQILDLAALGLSPATMSSLDHSLNLANGILLVTGPTGSGKTTTLYACLQALHSHEKKIMTVEDPVEYQIDGINQIQAKPQIGLGFSEALRSILRQDPDIIMIGEMRDLDTAKIAIQSALTGHLVFSTLHTNDAGSSITRLLDIGIEDYLITSTVNGVMAQRLLRKLCPDCKQSYQPSSRLLIEWGISEAAKDSAPIQIFRAHGCDKCFGKGYSGRLIISEFMQMNSVLRDAIIEGVDGHGLQSLAINHGMQTLRQDGMQKALQGLTSIEEVLRVT